MTVGPWRTLRGQLPTVATFADLRLTEGRVGGVVYLRGYYEDGDGGEGLFAWDDSVSAGDDDGTIAGSSTGRWVRQFEGAVSPKWFGAKGDGVTEDTLAIQAAIDYLGSAGGEVFIPNGVYLVDTLTVGGGDQVNSITLRGEVPVGFMALERLVVDQVIPDVGTMLKFVGDDDSTALLHIRNCDQGALHNLCFASQNLATVGVLWTHTEGDDRPPYNWSVHKCSAIDAREYNWKTEGTGGTGYGDMSGLTFYNCMFPGSHDPCTTVAHFCNSTQYTFGVTFVGPVAWSETYPSYALDLHSGTANVFGGDMMGTVACIRLLATAGLDFPSVNVYGCESQSGGKFLVTDSTPVGENTPNRSSTVIGLLCDDIVNPIATEMIYWDVQGEACLTLVGCNIFGDVNAVNTDSKVFVEGCYLRNSATFTGSGKVTGHWYQSTTPGTLQHRFASVPTYADNAAATAGGLVVGDLYATAAGDLMVRV